MSIETLIQELSAALKENSAEMKLARGAAPAAAATRPPARTPAAAAATTNTPAAARPRAGRAPAAAASQFTIEQVVAKAVELKDVIGRDETVKFVAMYGARASKDLKPEMWDQFVADVDERIAQESEPTDDTAGNDEV